MKVLMDSLIGLICLAILFGSFRWWLIVAKKRGIRFNKRNLSTTYLPLVIGGLIVLGLWSWNILLGIDPNKSPDDNDFNIILSIIALTLVFTLKNFFGPILIGATLSWAIYQYYQNQIFDLIPIFRLIVENLLYWASDLIQAIYTCTSLLVVLITSVIDSR